MYNYKAGSRLFFFFLPLLEAGGCVSAAACRTSALLADFDVAHRDTAGTASVKITLLWFCGGLFLCFVVFKQKKIIFPFGCTSVMFWSFLQSFMFVVLSVF